MSTLGCNFGGRCGWIQHEAGHNSLTGIIKIDKKLNNVAIFKLNTFLTKIYVSTKAPSIIIIIYNYYLTNLSFLTHDVLVIISEYPATLYSPPNKLS